ncbi:MAG: tetratricopeptide repeat protein [Deltaproteobacteria bacterium]|jgi:tetratricopeptide (TPR) repeat protein|nr:tetratricopeptide repeat protein [Deltaproteobacteria bacterium]
MAYGKSFWILVLLASFLCGCGGSGYNRYADDFYDQGIAWYHKGEYDRAVKDFTKVLEMAPEGTNNYIVYYNRGLAYYKLRDYDRAIRDFDTGLQLVAGRTSMGKYRPTIYDSSMEVPAPTTKLEYGVFNLYKARGDAWFYKKGYKEAVDDYDNALKYGEQRKELPTIYNSLAWAKFQMGAYKDAINDFSIAIDMRPQSARDYYGRSRAWAEIGDMNMALRDALVAHDLNPDSQKYDDLVFELKQKMKR